MDETFAIRAARAADRETVLAFCAQTWSWGDYLGWVWDQWLADSRGLFAVATLGGRPVAVDKLTFLSADEAFFEGLRVDPAYRGQGIASRLEEQMLAEAARQGARVVRLVTAADNTPVHKNATRHGFRRGPALVHWEQAAAATPPAPPALEPLMPGPDAAAAWTGLRHGALWAALDGLVSARWHVQEWTPALWAGLLAAGALWTLPGAAPGALAGLVALLAGRDYNPDPWLAWIDARPFTAGAITALAIGAGQVATGRGYGALQAMLPALPALDAGLLAAGWTSAGPGPEHSMLVFEKAIGP